MSPIVDAKYICVMNLHVHLSGGVCSRLSYLLRHLFTINRLHDDLVVCSIVESTNKVVVSGFRTTEEFSFVLSAIGLWYLLDNIDKLREMHP